MVVVVSAESSVDLAPSRGHRAKRILLAEVTHDVNEEADQEAEDDLRKPDTRVQNRSLSSG